MTEFKQGVKQFPTYNKPKGFGNRHILAIMGFIGFSLSYALRFNLSIAIVAMVNVTSKSSQDLDQILFQADVCPHPLKDHNNMMNIITRVNSTHLITAHLQSEAYNHFKDIQGRHDWNETIGEDSIKFYSPEYQFSPNITNPITPFMDLEMVESVQNVQSELPPPPENKTKNPITKKEEDDQNSALPGEFNWSESEQGLILASFFWGYIVTQIPGGYLGHRFGGKWPFGIGLLITGLLAILTPFAAHYGGMNWLIFVRVVQGFGGGITVPAMHGLLARWVPPNERGKLTAFVYAGMAFGSALSMIISGYIIHYLSWHWVFYVSGFVTIVWFAMWTYLIYSSPDEHPRISQEELKYIQSAIQGSSEFQAEGTLKKPPWKKILKSMPFWAVIFGQTSETWGLYTIMTELPTYMKTVLHFDIKENSLMSAFPHLLTWAVSILLTQIGDYFIEKRYFSTGTVRKACNTLGLWGSAAALIGVAYSGCDRVITVTLLGLAVAAMGGVYGGVLVNMIDIAPNYAGVLMGITNSCATIPGFLAPWVAGLLIDNNPSLERWRLVLLITAAISFFGNLLFLIFASGEEESWNRGDNSDENNKDFEIVRNNKSEGSIIDVPSFTQQFYHSGGPVSTTIPMTMVVTSSYEDHHIE